MGIDAVMAVALKSENDAAILNERFRKAHCKDDTLLNDEKDQDLVGGRPFQNAEWSEYVNTFGVHTGFHRFYGRGYERGPCLKIITQLEWLRSQPEVLEVFYDGDCGDGLQKWTKEDSEKTLWHFFKVGHSPYAQHWVTNSWAQNTNPPRSGNK
jgi:hypothetical protein